MSRREFVSAEAFHPWEYIADEIAARGWTMEEFAAKMPAPTPSELMLNLATMDFIRASYGMTTRKTVIGPETNARIAAAFGHSVEEWDGIEAAYSRAFDKHGPHKPEAKYLDDAD